MLIRHSFVLPVDAAAGRFVSSLPRAWNTVLSAGASKPRSTRVQRTVTVHVERMDDKAVDASPSADRTRVYDPAVIDGGGRVRGPMA